MNLSLTSWSFPKLTLEEAAGVARAIGVGNMDVSVKGRPGLDKALILADPKAAAERVQTLGVGVPNYYHHFGRDHVDRNISLPGTVEANARELEKALAFADAADIPTVFFLPGVVNAGQSRRQAMDAATDSLKAFLDIGKDFRVQICVEPIVHSWAEAPSLVRELVDRTGIGLALDYSHFVCLGYRQEEIDPLCAHAAHIHLRQARMGKLQEKLAGGSINFPALFGTLRDANYTGALAIEYIHVPFHDATNVDVMTETIAMRDCFNTWIAGSAVPAGDE